MNAGIIPSDSPSLFDSLKTLPNLERQAIVRPNNPPQGIAGFVFDIVGEEETELRSHITDAYVEDNTAIADNIALAPEEVTVRGVVAELVATNPPPSISQTINNPLAPNGSMVPALTPGATQTMVQTKQVSDAQQLSIASNASLYDYYNSKAGQQPNQTKQEKIFNYFYQLWKGRQLFSVQTPYGFWNDMAILSMRASQDEDTKYKSDFTITFKKIRTAQPTTVNVGQLAGRLAIQQAPTTQNGNLGTAPADQQSLLYRMTHPSP